MNTAEAYRIAAEHLANRPFAPTPEGYGDAVTALRVEADQLESLQNRNRDIGSELSTLYVEGYDTEAIGRKAWELVNADRKLHKPPTPDELAARDDYEN